MASTAPMKRPSPDDRRAAILEAAGQVFFEQGYAATSIDAIIERAGGSKRNIYSEFGSKEGLFTALVSESADAAIDRKSVVSGKGWSVRVDPGGRRIITQKKKTKEKKE